jgi:hypothetical protein
LAEATGKQMARARMSDVNFNDMTSRRITIRIQYAPAYPVGYHGK